MQKISNQAGQASPPILNRLLITFIRKFLSLLYHQLAWAYDWVATAVSLGAWQRWVHSVLPYLDGPRILEIGFGPGHLLEGLCHEGKVAFGIDESPEMIGIAWHRLKRAGLHPHLIRGDALALPFSNQSINQVVMTFPAEFMLKPATYTEIHRVLARDGRVVILPLAWITGRKPWERLAAWVSRIAGEAPTWDERMLDPLKNSGFKVTWEMKSYPSSKILLIHMVKI